MRPWKELQSWRLLGDQTTSASAETRGAIMYSAATGELPLERSYWRLLYMTNRLWVNAAGLAAAGWPANHHALALRDGHRDIAQHVHRAVPLVDLVEHDGRGGVAHGWSSLRMGVRGLRPRQVEGSAVAVPVTDS